MKKAILFTLFSLLGITLNGCSPPEPYTWSCPDVLAKNEAMESTGDTTIIVQVDGTPSMKGFVSNRNSNYIRTLRLIRGAATTAFPSSESPRFYAFGTKRLNLPVDRQEAEKKAFYDGSHSELRDAATYKMITPQKSDPKNSLYIIVTDLYQEKAQWEDLVDKLKDNYLRKNGYSVGIVALKSEFVGDIYDVGLDSKTYKNVKTNHPFYLLVLGKSSQVEKYFDAIKSGSKAAGLNIANENFVVFSTQLFKKSTSLEIKGNELNFKPQQIQSKIRRVDSLNDGNVFVKLDNNNLQNVERLKVSDHTSEKAPAQALLEYEIGYDRSPYTLTLNNSLRYEINQKSDFNQGKRDFIPLDTKKASIPIDLINWQNMNDNSIKFNALINLENNPQSNGIYRIIFDILPEKVSDSTKPYKAPSWWKDWSFGEKEFAGDKTYNLQPFLYSLGDTTFRLIEDEENRATKDNPKLVLGRLCFIIQKN